VINATEIYRGLDEPETALARARRLKRELAYKSMLVRKANANGTNAEPGTKCPHNMDDMLRRHAWLAGHYDKHGKDAWELAR